MATRKTFFSGLIKNFNCWIKKSHGLALRFRTPPILLLSLIKDIVLGFLASKLRTISLICVVSFFLLAQIPVWISGQNLNEALSFSGLPPF